MLGIFHSTDTLARTQLLSEHPNRRPSPEPSWYVEVTLPTMLCSCLLWYEITLWYEQSSVIHARLNRAGCWWHYPDHGCHFIKVNVLGSESSQCSGHLGGEDSRWTCIKFSNMQSPHWCCLMVGCVCFSQLGLKLWILDSSLYSSSTWHLSYCSDPGFPSLWHGSSHLLWALKFLLFVGFTKLFGFCIFLWSHMSFSRTHSPFSGLIYRLLSPGNANITGLKPDKCQFCNFTVWVCWVPN